PPVGHGLIAFAPDGFLQVAAQDESVRAALGTPGDRPGDRAGRHPPDLDPAVNLTEKNLADAGARWLVGTVQELEAVTVLHGFALSVACRLPRLSLPTVSGRW